MTLICDTPELPWMVAIFWIALQAAENLETEAFLSLADLVFR
jgi:hypothetical protein